MESATGEGKRIARMEGKSRGGRSTVKGFKKQERVTRKRNKNTLANFCLPLSLLCVVLDNSQDEEFHALVCNYFSPLGAFHGL